MKPILYRVTFLIPLVLLGCISGKKAFQRGNYYQSVLQSVQRLRKAPNNKKARATLEQAYPLALNSLEQNSINLKASNTDGKWQLILSNYRKINRMYEEIEHAPAAKSIITAPKNYYSEIEAITKNAAEEQYQKGLAALNKNTRYDAQQAFKFFGQALTLVPDYKDAYQKQLDAQDLATLKVLVTQVPLPASFSLSANYFQNKIEEFLNSESVRMDFVEFYNQGEQLTTDFRPDHILQLQFDEFTLGNVHIKEVSKELTKDSVVVATVKKNRDTDNEEKITICHHPPGNPENAMTLEVSVSALQAHIDHGDKIGPCEGSRGSTDHKKKKEDEYEDIYATVKATLTTFTKTIDSKGLMSMQILDASTNKILKEQKFPGEFVWQESWGTFNGDERALTEEQLALCKKREIPPPSRDEMFAYLSKPIFSQFAGDVRQFYLNY